MLAALRHAVLSRIRDECREPRGSVSIEETRKRRRALGSNVLRSDPFVISERTASFRFQPGFVRLGSRFHGKDLTVFVSLRTTYIRNYLIINTYLSGGGDAEKYMKMFGLSRYFVYFCSKKCRLFYRDGTFY